MVRKRLWAWSMVVLVAAGLTGSARADDDFARSGCFLGITGGLATSTGLERGLEDPLFTVGDSMGPSAGGYLLFPSADVDDTLAILGRAGCRGRYVGVEAQFEWLDGFDADLSTPQVGNLAAASASGTFDTWFLGGSLKLYPFAGRFQPYASAGLGYLRVDGSITVPVVTPTVTDALRIGFHEWDFATRLGGGLEVYLTRNLALTGDVAYVLPLSDRRIEDFEYLTYGGGLLLRF